MGSVTDLILVGDEAWTPEELRDALEAPRCTSPHHRALTNAEIHQVVREYRKGRRASLAASYGVSERTIQRYVRAYRHRPLRCPGERCLTLTPGGRVCHFCRRTEGVAA